MKQIKLLLAAFACLAITGGPALCAEFMSVKTSAANVRSGPGPKAAALWKAWKFTPLLVIKRTGAWAQVRDFEGAEGWVSLSALAKTKTVTAKANGTKVRAAAKANGEILWTVDKEYSFRVLGKKQGWVHVSDDEGTEGWIAASMLWGAI